MSDRSTWRYADSKPTTAQATLNLRALGPHLLNQESKEKSPPASLLKRCQAETIVSPAISAHARADITLALASLLPTLSPGISAPSGYCLATASINMGEKAQDDGRCDRRSLPARSVRSRVLTSSMRSCTSLRDVSLIHHARPEAFVIEVPEGAVCLMASNRTDRS